jgi:hypothetical protein
MDLPLWVVTKGLAIIEIDGVKPSTGEKSICKTTTHTLAKPDRIAI